MRVILEGETRRVLTQDWLVVAGWVEGETERRSLLYAPVHNFGKPCVPKGTRMPMSESCGCNLDLSEASLVD